MINRNRFAATAVAAMVLLAASTCAQAELLLYDGFSFSVGEYGGSVSGLDAPIGTYSTGGTGVSYLHTSQGSLDGTGFGLAASTGDKVDVPAHTAQNGASSSSATYSAGGVASGGLYGSVLFEVSSAADLATRLGNLGDGSKLVLSLCGPNGSYNGFLIRQNATNNDRFDIGFGGAGMDSGSYGGTQWVTNGDAGFEADTTMLIAFGTDATETQGGMSYWVNPDITGGIPAATGTGAGWRGRTGGKASEWRNNVLDSTGSLAVPGIILDELRVGTTIDDVLPVPEPATMAVLSLGGLALMRRRRA